jgi:hypothetical protein
MSDKGMVVKKHFHSRRLLVASSAVVAGTSLVVLPSASMASASPQPAEPGTGIATAWYPTGSEANVYYVGTNGQIYNWYWGGSSWSNSALGTGEAAMLGTGVATA